MNNQCLSLSDIELISSLDIKKILITGGAGMLGSAFINQISSYLPGVRLIAPNKSELDICNTNDIYKIESQKPDLIIHCAGLVNADLCELQPELARDVILNGTKNICDLAMNCNSLMLYPQTFLIYGEVNDEIDENTVPNPMSIYGALKLEAEKELLRRFPKVLSLRLGGFFGGGEKDKNFVGKFLEIIKSHLSKSSKPLLVGDRIWQPTYTEEIAANALLLIALKKSGIYCMASHGSASFFDVANEIINILGLSEQIKLKPVIGSYFSEKEAARRPKRAILNNKRLKSENLDRQSTWSSALKGYLQSPVCEFNKSLHDN
jgi:dTDP-4-dehydrorhamnose reductase